MATIVLQVPDENLVTKVKQACKMLMGVTSVKVQKSDTKKYDITKTAGYCEAMDDIKNGRVHHADSVDDMFKQIFGWYMYSINYTNRFSKDLKRCKKRGLNIKLIQDAIVLLSKTGTLPTQYHPHRLSGNRQGQWECHIQPDWLMTWEQNDTELTLLFLQTGTHSDLF